MYTMHSFLIILLIEFKYVSLFTKLKKMFTTLLLGTPYWNQGAKKQYYVSKRCSSKKECDRTRKANMPDCSHIWYLDWKCSDCCQGDRCNYYIIVSCYFYLLYKNINKIIIL